MVYTSVGSGSDDPGNPGHSGHFCQVEQVSSAK